MKKKTGANAVALINVYPGEGDTPLVVVDPPANLPELLAEWERLDAGDEDGDPLDGWDTIQEWLEARGVVFAEPDVYDISCD